MAQLDRGRSPCTTPQILYDELPMEWRNSRCRGGLGRRDLPGDRRRRELTMRCRTAVGLAVMVTLTLLGGARAWSVAADGYRRVQESEARQSHLYRQLADKDAVLESQRRIYMERFRRLEAQVRDREQVLAVLRVRLLDRSPLVVCERVD